jgi:hypothetical protein
MHLSESEIMCGVVAIAAYVDDSRCEASSWLYSGFTPDSDSPTINVDVAWYVFGWRLENTKAATPATITLTARRGSHLRRMLNC